MKYFCFDIETCPLDREDYLKRDEAERKKLLNPIDSSIVAIGVKETGKSAVIIQGKSEKEMLEKFWSEFAAFRKQNALSGKLVGFNVKDFDLPILVTRSFINEVKIVPFTIKEVIDLRESISAFTYKHTRGKMKEFAQLIGIETIEGFDGENVAKAHWNGEHKKIATYLEKDLEIIEKMNERIVRLGIDKIQKW